MPPPPSTVLVGTFTGGPGGGMEPQGPPSASEGIYAAQFDPATGALSRRTLVARAAVSPSWLRWHPALPVLYANGETFDAAPSSVAAFRVTASGRVEEMGRVSTGGAATCHLSVHPRRCYIAAASYSGGGSTAVLSIDAGSGDVLARTALVPHAAPTDPALLADPRRRRWEPHAHSANWDPAGRYLLVCDAGTDRIIVYAFDEGAGTLAAHSETMVTVGGGARHLTFHPGGRRVYANEEAGARVGVYDWDGAAGRLTPTQTLSTLPEGFAADRVFTSECSLRPQGDVLYVGNRVYRGGSVAGSIASFAVAADGSLSPLAHTAVGRHPRHFAVDPTGEWMLCPSLHDHRVDVFRLDSRGVPRPTGSGALAVPSPTHCLFADPARALLAGVSRL